MHSSRSCLGDIGTTDKHLRLNIASTPSSYPPLQIKDSFTRTGYGSGKNGIFKVSGRVSSITFTKTEGEDPSHGRYYIGENSVFAYNKPDGSGIIESGVCPRLNYYSQDMDKLYLHLTDKQDGETIEAFDENVLEIIQNKISEVNQ